ncbi:hypothetical protein M8J76_000714 [Diaphorina citri]|nr:hypothetical protein M8J75_014667 [Diaphorina citri]KAI5726321.1 hypothetical protein M8J76_000714 [Diaphorina citri]KAI5732285.1 hypothetical protein M8J77_024285 [Diaphorina citri]
MPNLPEVTPPSVAWAQRNHCIFLTICLEDCKNPTINLDKNQLYFDGIGGTEKKHHQVTIPFYKEINAEKSQTFVRERNIEILIKKTDDDKTYWPHLTKEKNKYHWLKVDFNKWKDEDDSDDENNGGNFEDLMRSMGGLMGDSSEKPNFDDLDPQPDSDDEDIPELEE